LRHRDAPTTLWGPEAELRGGEADLRKAQAELAHGTRVTTMGELAASIANEVNQPIAGVVLSGNACMRWLSRLKEDPATLAEARQALQRIIRDGTRAGEVIARIRALFKNAETAKEALDINDVVREVMEIVKDIRDLSFVAVFIATALAPRIISALRAVGRSS
jgi:C4-dicarboxylate-specific signal transduction histidine kinase